jgi:hypothetical protein
VCADNHSLQARSKVRIKPSETYFDSQSFRSCFEMPFRQTFSLETEGEGARRENGGPAHAGEGTREYAGPARRPSAGAQGMGERLARVCIDT